MRQRTNVLLLLCAGALLGGVLCVRQAMQPQQEPRAEIADTEAGGDAGAAQARDDVAHGRLQRDPANGATRAAAAPAKPATASALRWPDHQPLDPDERERFDAAAKKVSQLAKWGRRDEGELDALRQTLWELSDRGAAEYGRELASLTAEAVREGASQAGEVMNQISMLDFLAKADRPVAKQVVRDIAQTPLEDPSTKGTPRVQRLVTLNVFDTWAASEPEAARAFIEARPESERKAYIYHYYIGRQLAGVDQNERLEDVSANFGPQYIAMLGLDG